MLSSARHSRGRNRWATGLVKAHFGPARQGLGRDSGSVTQLIERMEVRPGYLNVMRLATSGG